jgi:hypothetical protein
MQFQPKRNIRLLLIKPTENTLVKNWNQPLLKLMKIELRQRKRKRRKWLKLENKTLRLKLKKLKIKIKK